MRGELGGLTHLRRGRRRNNGTHNHGYGFPLFSPSSKMGQLHRSTHPTDVYPGQHATS